MVTLRNVLDRETISVLDEAASLFGPLRGFGRAAALNCERRAERLGDLHPPAARRPGRPSRADDAAAADRRCAPRSRR